MGFSGTQSAPGWHPTPAGAESASRPWEIPVGGNPTPPTSVPWVGRVSLGQRRVSLLLPGLYGRRGLSLPSAHSSFPGRKSLLLSVSPSTSEMVTY